MTHLLSENGGPILKKQYNVRANVGIDGKNYTKYGTNYDIQLLVIDKTGQTTQETATGKYNNLSEIEELLRRDFDDRSENVQSSKNVEQKPNKPSSTKNINKGKNPGKRGGTIPVSTDNVGTKQPGSRDDGARGTDGRVPGDRGTINNNTEDTAKPDKSNESSDENRHTGEPSADNGGRTTGTENSNTGSRVYNRTDGNRDGRQGNDKQPGIRVKNQKNKQNKAKDIGDSVYSEYAPQKLKIEGAKPHPGKLAQSSAMAAVEPPNPEYTPKLATISNR